MDCVKDLVKTILPNLEITLKSCTSLKDMIANCANISGNTQLTSPNLLDFLLKGLSITGKCSVDKKLKKSLKGIIIQILKEEYSYRASSSVSLSMMDRLSGVTEEIDYSNYSEEQLAQAIVDLLIPETEGRQVMKVLNFKNPKQKIIEALGNKLESAHIIDIYDLMDMAGKLFCELHTKILIPAPFVVEFIDDIEEYASCDIKAGVANEVFSLNASLKTEGVKETWNFFKSRLEVAEE